MVPQVTGSNSSLRNFFLRCSPNWPISYKLDNRKFFEIELGRGNGLDWHETRRMNVLGRISQKWAQESSFSVEKWHKKCNFFTAENRLS